MKDIEDAYEICRDIRVSFNYKFCPVIDPVYNTTKATWLLKMDLSV